MQNLLVCTYILFALFRESQLGRNSKLFCLKAGEVLPMVLHWRTLICIQPLFICLFLFFFSHSFIICSMWKTQFTISRKIMGSKFFCVFSCVSYAVFL